MDALLETWGLGELIETFQTQGVDLDTFPLLNETSIKELIPRVGPRLKFLQKWKEQQDFENAEIIYQSDTSDLSLSNTDDFDTNKMSLIPELLPCSSFETFSPSSSVCSSPAVLEYEQTRVKRNKKVDVEEILNAHIRGRAIIAAFRVQNKLESSTREEIVRILIDFYLEEYTRGDIERLHDIAEGIITVFPTEIKETYYCKKRKNVSGKIHTIVSGKLVYRLYNVRKKLKLPSVRAIEEEDLIDDCDDMLAWLHNSIEPWNQVEEYWKLTFKVRLKQVRDSSDAKVSMYLKDYPALRGAKGYILLEQDFNTSYPSSSNFFVEWPILAADIVKFVKSKKGKEFEKLIAGIEASTSEDEKNLRVLMLLPNLLKPAIIKKTKSSSSGRWRFISLRSAL